MSLVKINILFFQKQSSHSSPSEPAIVSTLTILSGNVSSDVLTSAKRFTEMSDGRSTAMNLYGDVMSPCMSVKHARRHCLSVNWTSMESIRAVSNYLILIYPQKHSLFTGVTTSGDSPWVGSARTGNRNSP